MPASPEPVFEVVHRSPDGEPAHVVICILTRGRPHMLAETLGSLAEQTGAPPFVCLVADNDAASRDGASAAAAVITSGRIQGAAVVVPRPGHCSASNGAFAAARALYPDVPFLAMVDDDETADPAWLATLVAAQRASGADLVGGPVVSRFERLDARAFAAHPVFKPFYGRSGPVAFLYGSGNFLMSAAVLDRVGQPAFDPAFDFTGGGDFAFFLRCRDLGFRSVFAAEALCTETVPAARTRVRWVLARSMRYGTINYMIESRAARTRLSALKVPAKSLCLLGLAPFRALRTLAASRSLLAASHPVMEAIGRIAAPFGLRPEQYRVAERHPS